MTSVVANDLADFIDKRTEMIVRQWLVAVREQIPASRPFGDEVIIDSLRKYLHEAANVLRGPTTPTLLSYSLSTAREHGRTRTHLQYDVGDVVTEYSVLRETIITEASKNMPLPIDVLANLSRISDAGLINAVKEFLEDTVIKDERVARQTAERSEKQLGDFFMQAPEPMAIFEGPEHLFVVANAPYIDLIGRNPVGKKVREVFSAQEAGDFFTILDEVYKTGSPYIGKEMIFRRPGADSGLEECWINIAYYPARKESDEITGIHAFVHDVTIEVNARKAAEHAKHAVEHERENFENLFEQTPEMICILEGPEHRFRFVNSAHIKTLGFDATGMSIREAQPESSEIHGILDEVYSSGQTAELSEIAVTVNGHLRNFNVTYAAHRDLNDRIDGVMILGTEVTEEVVSREALKLQGKALELSMSEAPLSSVLEVMTQFVEMQAGDSLIASVLLADKEQAHLFHGAAPRLPHDYNALVNGISIGPNVGSCGAAAFTKKRTVVTDISTDPRWADYKDLALSYGLRACWSTPILSPRDQLLGTFALYSKVARAPSARELEIVGVAAQTTALIIERRVEIEERLAAAREAERANAAKSAFLANMSHEIRTPLGAIMGFADLARQPEATKNEITSYLGVVERNSIQVLRIIDDILDLAKVEAGRIELENMEISLAEFLADFISLIGFRARENGIAFGIKAETDLPERICTDPTRLRQILTNSVGNAIKFTTEGAVTLHVCFKDGLLEFGIHDTGRGISQEQAKNLFQAFVQADTSTTRKFGGTGLGLVLTKRLCQLMGGDYVLKSSELGSGSLFNASVHVRLPSEAKLISKDAVIFETTTESTPRPERGRLDGVSVLLVEDSPDNQVLVRLILERQGAKLTLANDGVMGVEKALVGRYDVVLMDIQMPRMDGHEAIRKLRESGYTRPVVALTAHAMREEAERARKSGFTDFLSKPIQREALITMVEEFSKKST